MMQRMTGLRRFVTAFFLFLCFLPSVSNAATVDVMIVYDSTAKSWVDSHGGMNTFAADAVARMNQATTNSNVDLTFRLARAAEVSYTYSGDLRTDLSNLQTGAGNLSVVHGWRNTYGADLVVLLVDTGSAYGWVGIGYLLMTYAGSPAYAFTVSAIRSVDISHTLTHEIGHNLGCDHSKNQASDPGPNAALNSYSAGWYFTGTNAVAYHTIMAYGDDGYGHFYAEAPLFSTPLLSYEGTVAGQAQDGDNARTIRETMNVVAAYRVADTVPDPFTFIDQTNVALNTVITSNTITVSGIGAAAPISITGGTYSINGGSYTSTSGTVTNGNTVTVRQTSSGSHSTTTNSTLTIGGVSDTFSVTTAPISQTKFIIDFDGDHKSDITVWRPGDGYWYAISSKDGSTFTRQWGSGPLGDKPVAGDYDGDGITDWAVWRPGDGFWYVLKSSNGGVIARQWGSSTLNDIPVPGDYDGDGKTDIAVWRPGDGFWYIISSMDGSIISRQWGAGYALYNDVPVPGDYDGDGKTDLAIWRQADGYWYIINSKDGSITSQQWGAPYAPYNDVAVPGDYDGDGKTDIAVWRPSEGMWYIISSKDGSIITQQWGAGYVPYNDVPVPGDYDGDGKTDIAVWRKGDGYWYILNSKDGSIAATQWGAGYAPYNDEPISQ